MGRGTGEAALLLSALIWGLCFVAQSVGMDQVGPFTFQAVRCLLGAGVLTPLALLRAGKKKKMNLRHLLQVGLLCGLTLFLATNLQQLGLMTTTTAKSGFITSMYMVLVPIFSSVMGKQPRRKHWLCVALAAGGLYLMSISDALSLVTGDLFTMGAAVFFACQIMVIDHFGGELDSVCLSCVQFWVTGALTCLPMATLETPTLEGLHAAALPIAYAGIMSCAVAYTLQIVGQKRCDPVVATVLMSLESVFSLLGGLLLLQQVPTPREALGCCVMFTAVLLSQLPVEHLLWRRKEPVHT